MEDHHLGPLTKPVMWDFGFPVPENESKYDNNYWFDFLGPEQSPDLGMFSPFCNVSSEVDFVIDQENYPMINYINQILMEENLVEHSTVDPDPLALQTAEKSFFEVLTKNFNPSTLHQASAVNLQIPQNSTKSGSCPDLLAVDQLQFSNSSSLLGTHSLDLDLKPISKRGEKMESLKDSELISTMFADAETMLQFKRGLEEGNKFLPTGDYQVFVDMPKYALPSKSKRIVTGSRGRKHHYQENDDDSNNHGRNSKHSAVYYEDAVELSETFDRVLLYGDSEVLVSSLQKNGLLRDEKKGRNKNVEAVDLVSLLLSCAHSIGIDDRITAIEQLKQIRQHASSDGDQYQRLAVIFANALEARLTGNGPDLYAAHISKKVSAAEELRAMRVYLCCPIKQMSSFLANTMIMNAASNSSTLHIVDFGIDYGFHWPSFIQLLSNRHGGPPKLRITGIDTPQSGFKPEEKLEDTGRRLARYCERFNVPFEYKVLAIKNWEKIKVEDLNLTRNEVVAVNCQFVLTNLLDETTGNENENPRDAVLSLIREMKPDIFINTSINASFGSSFFLSRFKEALFFFTTLFDLLDNNLPRDDLQRMNFEQNFLGLDVLNVVACEGSARVERPETYKHWQARFTRAGFRILPLEPDHMKELKKKTKEGYHKDFILCEDDNWMLLGWKGKVISASSCWVPA